MVISSIACMYRSAASVLAIIFLIFYVGCLLLHFIVLTRAGSSPHQCAPKSSEKHSEDRSTVKVLKLW